ncbi:hypothetical protein [Corynebacterium sp. A21]|uniref:hypothetical protein n=1 Tax=Corynebacterium sp. A21 TaxID=3457318 RepID=UPI003FD20CBD
MMSRTRRNPGWVTSGAVSDFLPAEIEVEEHEDEYWDGTLEHLHTMGKIAASRAFYQGTSEPDRRDTATSAISMALAENPDTTVWELLRLGQTAISREHQDRLGQNGARKSSGGTGARFAAYWEPHRPAFANFGLDRIAVHQVFDALGDRHQEDLLGAASFESLTEHAEAVGRTLATMSARVKEARQAALAAWFDWETPPPVSRRSRRHEQVKECPQGHAQNIHRKWKSNGAQGRKAYCSQCHRERNRKTA